MRPALRRRGAFRQALSASRGAPLISCAGKPVRTGTEMAQSGSEGMNIVVRIMGLLLAVIAVDMIAHGLRGEFPILTTPLP
jgi:hypothetical protein